MLFKDAEGINHRNDNDYRKMIGKLAEIVRTCDRRSPEIKGESGLNIPLERGRKHRPNHSFCGYQNSPQKNENPIPEKQICRCMYYFRKDAPLAQKEKCALCNFHEKRENVSAYKILDYEVPMPNEVTGVGGIDLLIEAPTREYYAVEVKPLESDETLVRMVAEILTYCEITDYCVDCRGAKLEVSPAICIFEGSKQWKDYKKYRNDADFQAMMSGIKVFYISYPCEGAFSIHDAAVDPIV